MTLEEKLRSLNEAIQYLEKTIQETQQYDLDYTLEVLRKKEAELQTSMRNPLSQTLKL